MNISKIVITGGPCAGKSSAMNILQNELEKLGYRVLIIAESATEFMSNGAKYLDPKFQRYLIEYQLEKERICEEFAKHLNNKAVILLDRGCMDCKAYTTSEEWVETLEELNTDEFKILNNYQAVFHLISTAKGKENAYTQENNSTRFETKEEAIIADDNVLNVWANHPYRKIIDNYPEFEDKVKCLLSEIIKVLNSIPK